jgi:hypothetical protein
MRRSSAPDERAVSASPKGARRVAWALAALGALWLCALWWAELGQPIYDDEVPFVRAAQVLHSPDPARYVIPHPPLTLEAYAATLALPLPPERAMRVAALVPGLLTLALLPLAGRALLPGDTPEMRAAAWLAGGLAALVYAALPLAVQSASVLDIDNTWLVPLTLAPFLAWGARSAAPRIPRAASLAVLIALALWAKLLTTPFVPAALGLYALARRDWRALRDVIAATALGALLFGLSFGAYAALTRFPVEQFAVTFAKANDVGGAGAMARRALQGGGILFFWIGVPLAALWLVESARAALRLVRGQALPIDAPALFAWIVGAFYLLVRELPYGFPRYEVPMLPALALMCAWPVARALAGASRRTLVAWSALAAVAALYGWLVVGDPLLAQYRLTFETQDVVVRAREALLGLLVAVPLPLAAVAAGGWLLKLTAQNAESAEIQSEKTPRALRSLRFNFVALALFVAGMGGALATDAAQARADYALRYSYGREGTWAVVAQVRAPGAPDGALIAPQEILYHTGRAGTLHYALFCPTCKPGDLLAALDAQPAFVILTQKEARRYTQVAEAPEVVARLARCYARSEIGSYVVYTRTCQSSPS